MAHIKKTRKPLSGCAFVLGERIGGAGASWRRRELPEDHVLCWDRQKAGRESVFSYPPRSEWRTEGLLGLGVSEQLLFQKN